MGYIRDTKNGKNLILERINLMHCYESFTDKRLFHKNRNK